MGQIGINRQWAIDALKKANSFCDLGEIAMYVDSFLDYVEAQNNIIQYGNIVNHPRTGAPIVNPYIEIKMAAMKSLRASKIENSTVLWSAVKFEKSTP